MTSRKRLVSGTKGGAACAGVLPRKDSVCCPGHPDAQAPLYSSEAHSCTLGGILDEGAAP